LENFRIISKSELDSFCYLIGQKPKSILEMVLELFANVHCFYRNASPILPGAGFLPAPPCVRIRGVREMVDDTEDGLWPSTTVQQKLCRSDKTLRKLENDPEMCFPKKIIIQGRKYWKKSEILNWIDDMQVQSEGVNTPFHGDKRRAAE
jgi:predicted DNA-binding transcriptional regulator AlpA